MLRAKRSGPGWQEGDYISVQVGYLRETGAPKLGLPDEFGIGGAGIPDDIAKEIWDQTWGGFDIGSAERIGGGVGLDPQRGTQPWGNIWTREQDPLSSPSWPQYRDMGVTEAHWIEDQAAQHWTFTQEFIDREYPIVQRYRELQGIDDALEGPPGTPLSVTDPLTGKVYSYSTDYSQQLDQEIYRELETAGPDIIAAHRVDSPTASPIGINEEGTGLGIEYLYPYEISPDGHALFTLEQLESIQRIADRMWLDTDEIKVYLTHQSRARPLTGEVYSYPPRQEGPPGTPLKDLTPDEIDQIVRNEGGLTDAEIEREMRRSGGYVGGGLTDSDLDRLARPEPGISADPLDEEIAREIGPGPGPGWKTADDIPASKAGQVWRTPDNVWGTATDEELLVLLHHARMEAKRKIDPSLSMMGENRPKEFLTNQQVDWASRELTNRGYTPTRGIDDPWQELNWGNIGVDRHPSGELFKDFDYEDTLLGIQAKVRSWYDTEYWPQQVANTKTGLQTAPDLDLDIGISGTRMGWTLPREEAPSVWGTRAGREAYSDGTEMRLRFYSEEKLAAYMDDRYFQPGNQPRALEYRKLFEDEYARRRAIEAETGKPYDPGPRPPGHPSTWRLPEGE